MLKFGMNKCTNLLFQAFFSEFDYVDSIRIFVIIFCVIWKKSYCSSFITECSKCNSLNLFLSCPPQVSAPTHLTVVPSIGWTQKARRFLCGRRWSIVRTLGSTARSSSGLTWTNEASAPEAVPPKRPWRRRTEEPLPLPVVARHPPGRNRRRYDQLMESTLHRDLMAGRRRKCRDVVT